MKGFLSFEFDLPGALLEQLIEVLDKMADEGLSADAVRQIPDAQGVYQLFLDDQLVYIGKTDAEAGLRKRLLRHAAKILNRPMLATRKVTFKAVQVLVFTAIDLETALIKHYEKHGAPATWNGSGFGANDPGRNREKTNQKPEGFDASYPISVDIVSDLLPIGRHTVASALAKLKSALTYTLRYETETKDRKAQRTKPHGDLLEANLDISREAQSVRELLVAMLAALPDGWQATVFSGYAILYKEHAAYTTVKISESKRDTSGRYFCDGLCKLDSRPKCLFEHRLMRLQDVHDKGDLKLAVARYGLHS